MEEIGYTHRFSPEELAQKKESLAEISIKINDIEVEKKEVMEGFKEHLKPLRTTKVELLANIKEGAEYRANEEIEVEIYADVDGRDVSLTLVSAGANEAIEEYKNKVIDEQIEAIRMIAPCIVIIEV